VIEMLIQHHVRYKETHGADEIRLMTPSEHKILHNRLRREGRCTIPVSELSIITRSAHQRTRKRKVNLRNYNALIKKRINFVEQVARNVQLFERIIYNQNTGHAFIHSGFNINGHGRLLVIDEKSEVH
jgi:hypothetical protein